MYHNWFESKVRYEKTMENGKVKKVAEPYLVDALALPRQKHVQLKQLPHLFRESLPSWQ